MEFYLLYFQYVLPSEIDDTQNYDQKWVDAVYRLAPIWKKLYANETLEKIVLANIRQEGLRDRVLHFIIDQLEVIPNPDIIENPFLKGTSDIITKTFVTFLRFLLSTLVLIC